MGLAMHRIVPVFLSGLLLIDWELAPTRNKRSKSHPSSGLKSELQRGGTGSRGSFIHRQRRTGADWRVLNVRRESEGAAGVGLPHVSSWMVAGDSKCVLESRPGWGDYWLCASTRLAQRPLLAVALVESAMDGCLRRRTSCSITAETASEMILADISTRTEGAGDVCVSEMRGTGGDIRSRGAATKEYEGTLGPSPHLTPTSRRPHRSAIAGRLLRIMSIAVAGVAGLYIPGSG